MFLKWEVKVVPRCPSYVDSVFFLIFCELSKMPFWKENVKNLKACEDSIADGRDGAYQYSTGCLNVYEVTPAKKPPQSSTLGRKNRMSSSPNEYCQCTLHAGKHYKHQVTLFIRSFVCFNWQFWFEGQTNLMHPSMGKGISSSLHLSFLFFDYWNQSLEQVLPDKKSPFLYFFSFSFLLKFYAGSGSKPGWKCFRTYLFG